LLDQAGITSCTSCRILDAIRSSGARVDNSISETVTTLLRSTAIEGTATDLRQDVSPDGTIGNPGAMKETEVLASSNPSSEDIASNQTTPSTIVVPGAKVFIQIFYEAQHEEAAKLQTVARSIGVAGICRYPASYG
jgi:hypothetical protein